MNQQSKKYLQDRLKKAKRIAYSAMFRDRTVKPDAVRKAEQILRVWSSARMKRKERVRTKVETAVRVVEEAVLFGEPVPALTALRKFEKMKFAD